MPNVSCDSSKTRRSEASDSTVRYHCCHPPLRNESTRSAGLELGRLHHSLKDSYVRLFRPRRIHERLERKRSDGMKRLCLPT